MKLVLSTQEAIGDAGVISSRLEENEVIPHSPLLKSTTEPKETGVQKSKTDKHIRLVSNTKIGVQ